MRRNKQYTEMGRKIASLAKHQKELAAVLDLTQQSVSGKLRGSIGITLRDLETLADFYHVPQIFFLMPEGVTSQEAKDLVLLVQPSNYVNLEMARRGLRKFPVQFWQMVADEWKMGVLPYQEPLSQIKEIERCEALQRTER